MKPICLMIMPYGKKPTQADAAVGVPVIDFNALWDRAYAPAIKELGFDPVRADQDVGALIITQMIERLYFADLVLADMTIPNGNVYYELGIRHAAKQKGCVMLAADWSKQLFDVAQMRTIRYPLAEGDIREDTAAAIARAITPEIQLRLGGTSPVFDVIRGYPGNVDMTAASTMKETMAAMASFQGKMRGIRSLPLDQRMPAAKRLAKEACEPPVMAHTALAVVKLLYDCANDVPDWTWVSEFMTRLPADIAEIEEISEKSVFACAKAENSDEAIAKLEALIVMSGPTPERLGILGGRFKRSAKTAKTPADLQFYLNKSIDCYQRGMEIDLNQYYCSGNLPNLYRQRNQKGDRERAASVSQVVIAACERARKRNTADEWLRPTLLGVAFYTGDADKAEALATEVIAEGSALWKLDTTLEDLRVSASWCEDAATRSRLFAVIERFEQWFSTRTL